MKVTDFLQVHNIRYDVLAHRQTFDAQHLAQALHVSGREVAKTVLLRADLGYKFVVAVLPATRSIDLDKASQALGGSQLELATEAEIGKHCPDCEIGVLPPFGSQYGLRTLVDESLAEEEEIVFEGNTHDEAIRMKFADYRQLESPLVAEFAH